MPEHPFTFDYIGLGLLDEASIRRENDSWAADYGDAAGSPYLTVHVGPSRIRIEELDAGGRVALTVAPTITQAIGMHGSDALGDERSRFWERVAASTPLAWVETAFSNARYSFIPAIGIGQLCLPLPADVEWRAPEPGPIARRIGFHPFDDAVEIGPAKLTRFADGRQNPEQEPIRLVKVSLPGILVPEAVAACFNAHGPARSLEVAAVRALRALHPGGAALAAATQGIGRGRGPRGILDRRGRAWRLELHGR